MSSSSSFIGYVYQASPIVKVVLAILIIASVFSWTYILQKYKYLKQVKSLLAKFEKEVWLVSDLGQFYQKTQKNLTPYSCIEKVFTDGYQEYSRMLQIPGATDDLAIEATTRAMAISQAETLDQLEENLPALATIGSVSPYIGLFGTVWGIMMAFHSLSGAEQVTIAMVAPGIAEALIATAVGLFAAIPAVIAFNRYSNSINLIGNRLQYFQERFSLLLKQISLSRGA